MPGRDSLRSGGGIYEQAAAELRMGAPGVHLRRRFSRKCHNVGAERGLRSRRVRAWVRTFRGSCGIAGVRGWPPSRARVTCDLLKPKPWILRRCPLAWERPWGSLVGDC